MTWPKCLDCMTTQISLQLSSPLTLSSPQLFPCSLVLKTLPERLLIKCFPKPVRKLLISFLDCSMKKRLLNCTPTCMSNHWTRCYFRNFLASTSSWEQWKVHLRTFSSPSKVKSSWVPNLKRLEAHSLITRSLHPGLKYPTHPWSHSLLILWTWLSVSSSWKIGLKKVLLQLSGSQVSSSPNLSSLVSNKTSPGSTPLPLIWSNGTMKSWVKNSIPLRQLKMVPTSMVCSSRAVAGIQTKAVLKSLSQRYSTPKFHKSIWSLWSNLTLSSVTPTHALCTRLSSVSVLSLRQAIQPTSSPWLSWRCRGAMMNITGSREVSPWLLSSTTEQTNQRCPRPKVHSRHQRPSTYLAWESNSRLEWNWVCGIPTVHL